MIKSIIKLFLACSIVISVSASETPQPVTITFYHTSDFHENSDGVMRIAEFIKHRRAEGGNILFVDTGDWFNKGDLSPLETRGEAILEMMGACEYDAVVPGNHDYAFGVARLSELAAKYNIPILTANWPSQSYPPYSIHTFKGVRVGIIGIATTMTHRAKDADMQIQNIENAVKDAVKKLENQADIMILLTHMGVKRDLKIAKAIPRLDIIFGGHNHIKHSEVVTNQVNRTIVQHSGAMGKAIGEVSIIWDGKKIVDRTMKVLKITKKMKQSEELRAILNKYLHPAVCLPKTDRINWGSENGFSKKLVISDFRSCAY